VAVHRRAYIGLFCGFQFNFSPGTNEKLFKNSSVPSTASYLDDAIRLSKFVLLPDLFDSAAFQIR
jgi:hypothetical protein